MRNPDAILLVLSTFADTESAERCARALVERELCACGNILPGARSIYRWQGKVEDASETLVLFKTTRAVWDAFREALTKLHPYEVPEILMFPVKDGLPTYLNWVRENCKQSAGG